MVYKNIICFFSCSFLLHEMKVSVVCVCVRERERDRERQSENRRWLKCSQIGVTVWLFCETSLPLYFVLSGPKSSPVHIIYANVILVVACPVYALHVDTPPVKHATQETYAGFPMGKYLRPFYFRKQMYFMLFFCFPRMTLLACNPRNLRGISAVASASCLLLEADLLPVLPPINLRVMSNWGFEVITQQMERMRLGILRRYDSVSVLLWDRNSAL